MKKGNRLLQRTSSFLLIENIKQGKTFKISPEDESLLDLCTWSIASDPKNPYVRGRVNNKDIKLHTIILPNCPDGMVRDHVNRDKTDNTRGNLRFVSQRINKKNCSDGDRHAFIGVTPTKTGNGFRAQTTVEGKTKHIWQGKSIIDAAIAFDKFMFSMGLDDQTNLYNKKYPFFLTKEDIINYVLGGGRYS